MAGGASFNRHKSRQDIQTPPDFLRAVRSRYMVDFKLDAAASATNAVAESFYTEEQNGLTNPWASWTWCNPPYSDVEPWVKKAYSERKLGIGSFLLLPASVGSNWWKFWVHGKAHAILLNGRITFIGQKDPYPKDLAMLIYCPQIRGGYDVWSWQDVDAD